MQAVQKYYPHFFLHFSCPKKNMDDAETHLDLAIMHLCGCV
jgi:hypothetical protein